MTTAPTKTRSELPLLEADCRDSVQALRGQLIDLYASMDLDPNQPQEVARRLQLNKNLTWKISKIINATDGISAIPHIPGAAGMEILLTAVEAAGAPRKNIDGVRGALDHFDHVVERHAGDRAHLDLMLDSMGLSSTGMPLLSSRELAFQGGSGLWGVQARTRVTAAFVVPNRDDPELVDTALVAGFVGFRRLRPAARWPLFRFQSYAHSGPSDDVWTDKGDLPSAHQPGDPPRLLRRFCSPKMPAVDIKVQGEATEYLLPPGPVGNQGAFDCFLGEIARGAPRYRSEREPYGEFSSSVTLPIETMVFDLILHESLQTTLPELRVYGLPMGVPYDPRESTDESLLPLAERCVELAGSPPAVATPLIPRYTELVHAVFGDLGFKPEEFRGMRLLLRWPPMPSTVMLRWPLPERPA